MTSYYSHNFTSLAPSSINSTSSHNKEKTATINNENENFETKINPTFTEELKELMFGFGDRKNPDNETALLLQEYVIEYLQNLSAKAYRRSRRKGGREIALNDLLYVLKNDKKRFYKALSLIEFYENRKREMNKMNNNVKNMAKFAEKS